MKQLFQKKPANLIRSFLLTCFILSAGNNLFGQQATTVLPNNSNFSNKNSPQGALRFQRGFYLIRSAEMNSSGFNAGMDINSIGFTLAGAQSDTTHGRFRLFLQNTPDTVSRADTSWIEFASPTNAFPASGLFPGKYEWQVKANCGTSSAFSSSINFANDNLSGCNNPYNLSANSITTSSATLTWEAAASPGFVQYQLEYSRFDVVSWTAVTTTDTFYNVTALVPGIAYQWRVKTNCGAVNSPINSSTFTTNTVSVCNLPTPLPAVVTNDTLVKLSWTAAAGANYYEVRFRRSGTNAWSNALSFTDSANFVFSAGTTFEWQVRTFCDSISTSDFIPGPGFNTGGTQVCYMPTNITTSQITDSSATLTWTPVTGATSYTVRYRTKNTISWNNAISAMIPVCDSLITFPKITGAYDIPFSGGNTFDYNGQGVYVAWEYSRPSGNLTSANLTLSTNSGTALRGSNGQDSTNLLCMVSRADTGLHALPNIMGESRLRPETRFGSTDLKDSVEVVAVYTLGKLTPQFQSPAPIAALIANKSATGKTYTVHLNIKEQSTSAARYAVSASLAVAANDTAMISFSGWLPVILEKDSIIISIDPGPGENVVNNNSKGYLLTVNGSVVAYEDGTAPLTSAGFDTLSGLLLTRYSMKGCGKVTAAQVFIAESAEGHPLYAVVRDTAGAIVAQSPAFTPGNAELNTYHSFYFNVPPSFRDEDFYIGIAQQASVNASRPVGTQYENSVTRTDAYYRADLDGTNLVDSPQLGRLMIRAEISSSAPEAIISGNLNLCAGSSTTLTAGSNEVRYASSISGYSSQSATAGYDARQALGTPNVFPAYGVIPGAWFSNSADGQREYLDLNFTNPDSINFIDIYETLNPGAVDTVWVKNPGTSLFDVVYTHTAAATSPVAGKNHIPFTLTPYLVSEIRLAINSPAVPGYNAIDAVAIGKSTVPATFSSYSWAPGGDTTQNITVSTPGVYKLTVTNAGGCQSSDSVTVVAAATTAPVITASGPLSFCQGNSVWLRSSIHGGNTWSTSANTDSILVTTSGTYSVSYDVGCGTLTSASVTVTVNTPPVVNITGSTGICAGGSTTLDAGSGYITYLWSNNATTSTINVSTPGLYAVTVTDNNGCTGTSGAITTILQVPNPEITGATEFCAGTLTILDAGAGYNSYTWSTGATTQTISVGTAGNFSVIVSNGAGCFGYDTVTTTVLSATKPVITGSLNFCAGSSTTLDAGAGYNSYLWSTGALTQTIAVSTAETFIVTALNNNGCPAYDTVTTTILPLPTPAITGVLQFCPGSSSILDAGAGYITYLWSTGATTRTITVSTADVFTVTVSNGGGCVASNSVTTSLNTVPAPQITGNAGFCTGGTVTLTATPGFAGYAWSNGATTQTITVNSAATYMVTVTDNNGCTGSASKSVVEFPPLTPAISGTLSFCGGTSTTLNAGPGYSSYLWNTGATTQTINVNTVGTFTVTVTNANGCSASASATTTNTGSLPAVPGPISGPAIANCNTSGNVYFISAVPNTSHYVWNVPSGATIVSGQGSTSISVNFGATFQGGNIVVAASNACGQSPSIVPRLLFVQALANNPGAISGQESGLCGPTTKTYSIASVPMATSYTWSVPSGASIISGQTTTSVTVSFSAGFSFGNICVTANNACGSTVPSCKLLSGVSPTPGAIRGPTAVCRNQSNLMYAIDPVAGATSYTWTVPQSAQISYGQGTTNIVVKMGPNGGNITVKANSACGSSGVRTLAVIVTTCFYAPPIFTMPETRPVPEVVSNYGGSATSGNMYFEWTLGEPRIELISKPGFLFTQGFHQPLIYFIPVKQTDTAVLVASDKIKIMVYPNPVSTVLKVKVETADSKPIVLELVDVYSRLLQQKKITSGVDKNLVEFQMTGYIGGSYYLVVRDTDGLIINTIKLVKLN